MTRFIKTTVFCSFFIMFTCKAMPPTDYLTLQGFDVAHAKGYTGKGQVIAVISDVPDVEHPAFVGPFSNNQIQRFDVTSFPEPIVGEDKSDFRYPAMLFDAQNYRRSTLESRDDKYFYNHGNHVVGLINGQAKTDPEQAFLGGAAPGALVHAYETSGPKSTLMPQRGGHAIFTLYEMVEKYRDYKKKEILQYMGERSSLFQQHPFNGSLLRALQVISETQSSPVAINCSFVMLDIMDPSNADKVPDHILNQIGDSLEKADTVLVISANNDNGVDLSGPAPVRNPFDGWAPHPNYYIRQFADHPKIGPRLLIAVNAQPDQKLFGHESLNHPTTLASGKEISLFHSSNIPGDSLWSFAVSAYGARNLSAWAGGGRADAFSIESGTSEAAPQIASLCALLKEKYPHMTASNIVERIKTSATAVPAAMRPIYGWGVMHAGRALELVP